MELSSLDLVTFVGFIIVVVAVSLYAARKEDSAEDYFLAGRGLGWSLIGFSLLASNISSEHFIGMSGEGFDMGLAIAAFEWIAVPALVFTALVLLPRFLQSGIYTIPEYLEYRYGADARVVAAVYFMLAYVFVAMAGVLYAGGLALQSMFGLELSQGVWLIGLVAGAYTVYGGLKAVVWTDLLQGATLLAGGAVVMVLGFQAVGGVEPFFTHNADKLHLILPADHPTMPWTVLLLGMWISNIFYWGCNQFIIQRALGAKDLKTGTRGVLFAAALKLAIPFITVFPGIMAFQLYGDQITDKDQAYAFLAAQILPAGLRGVMFAALFGAIMSSLDSMLNSASTILTIDLYRRRRPQATQPELVRVGRIATGVFVLIACLWAPFLARMEGLYEYMQVFWGSVSPAVCAVFMVGLVSKRMPARAGFYALVLGPVLYWLALYFLSDGILRVSLGFTELVLSGSYLNLMGLTFLVLCALMGLLRLVVPRDTAPVLPVRDRSIDARPDRGSVLLGIAIVSVVVVFYIVLA